MFLLKLYNIKLNIEQHLVPIFVLISFILLMFSPYLALISIFICALFTSKITNKQSYQIYLPFLIFCLAYLASSRGIFETPKDDLADYYKNFQALSNGNVWAVFEWGGGLEVGFPLISYGFSFFFLMLIQEHFYFFT